MGERGQAKHDAGKARYSLIPVGFVAGIARVLTWGASKPGYSDNGWQRVDRATERYYDALRRHLDAWRSGERYDTGEGGTGEHHLLCAATNVAILWWHDTVGGRCDATPPAPDEGDGAGGWDGRLDSPPPMTFTETVQEAAKVIRSLGGRAAQSVVGEACDTECDAARGASPELAEGARVRSGRKAEV